MKDKRQDPATADKKDKAKAPRQSKKHPQRNAFGVVFEDQHLLVADKPAGILTVPIPGKNSRNLQELLDTYLERQKRSALQVHRIDRYTSGLVLFAKQRKAREALVEQFRAHTPERTYLALVRGTPPEAGTLRHQLQLTTDGFRQHVVREGGTEAVTHFRVLERFDGAALLEVRLETGLKNQIRVQLRAVGHSLIGDRHYNPAEAEEKLLDRQALHAWKLAFLHPETHKRVEFESPLPHDLERAIRKLRAQGLMKKPPPPEALADEAAQAPSAPKPEVKRKKKVSRKNKGKRRIPKSKTE